MKTIEDETRGAIAVKAVGAQASKARLVAQASGEMKTIEDETRVAIAETVGAKAVRARLVNDPRVREIVDLGVEIGVVVVIEMAAISSKID
jgi:hypothetical protein